MHLTRVYFEDWNLAKQLAKEARSLGSGGVRLFDFNGLICVEFFLSDKAQLRLESSRMR